MLSRTQQDVLSTLCYLGMPFSEAHQAVSEGAAGRKGESFDELLEAVPERPATRGESRCLVPALRPTMKTRWQDRRRDYLLETGRLNNNVISIDSFRKPRKEGVPYGGGGPGPAERNTPPSPELPPAA